MKTKITWHRRKPRKSVAENVSDRIAANQAKYVKECNAVRARLSVLSPERQKAEQAQRSI